MPKPIKNLEENRFHRQSPKPKKITCNKYNDGNHTSQEQFFKNLRFIIIGD